MLPMLSDCLQQYPEYPENVNCFFLLNINNRETFSISRVSIKFQQTNKYSMVRKMYGEIRRKNKKCKIRFVCYKLYTEQQNNKSILFKNKICGKLKTN